MINVKVIADTIHNGKRITSLQLVMPRFILAQLNTHRVFSRNTASSRAIPTAKLIEQVRTDYVQPVQWGANKAGMQSEQELEAQEIEKAKEIWCHAAHTAADFAEQMAALGLHKQHANRIIEPYMWAHTIVTSTEWENFFKLRIDDAAQPEIQLLAQKMKEAMDKSVPAKSQVHLPYITCDELNQASKATTDIFLQLAPLSAARCARVSYLNHDQSKPDFKKDMETFQKLKSGGHWSPMEHQAIAITEPDFFVSDCDYNPITDELSEVFAGMTEPNEVRCRNFIGWQQFRDFHD